MSTSASIPLLPIGNARTILLKWIVALLAPLVVFTFVWKGYITVNQVLFSLLFPNNAYADTASVIQAAIFVVLLYATVITLAGYLSAADSGRVDMLGAWLNTLVLVVLPIVLVSATGNLIIGVAVSAVIWAIYFPVRNRLSSRLAKSAPLSPLDTVQAIDHQQQVTLMRRATAASFWLATILAIIWLVADVIYYFSGSLPLQLLIIGIVRTVLLPPVGYLLGRLGGRIALRHVLNPSGNGASNGKTKRKQHQLEMLSVSRATEEAKDLVPNDLPLQSRGAQRFFLLLVIAFVLFYPAMDQFLFGYGTTGRLAGYGDAGYYVILALGLNIVVGFAGLLDLGYVAFFAIGAYTWGLIGSTQLSLLTGIPYNPQVVSWLFWPMIIVTALIAALWGVALGAPTLRLRGDYLAIVTLGFGEIVPVVFLNLDKYTNGTNGLVGIRSPAFFGIDWSTITPVPYYYLILVLIGLTVLANVRLRDSRMGRAWIAIREDEIAASSSGINLVNTKLFAFAAGAFFSGIAGAYHSAKLGGVSPDTFSFGDSVIYLAMVVIGGIGSIPGVIVGALTVYAINLFILAQLDSLSSDPTSFMYSISHFIVHYIPGFNFGNIRNMVFGLVLVLVMIFRPEGLLPSTRRRRELHQANTEEVEVGPLDPPPGSAEFQAEAPVD